MEVIVDIGHFLPKEAWAEIFCFVNIRDLGIIPAVCTVWKEVSEIDLVWSKYHIIEKLPTEKRFKMHVISDLFMLLTTIKTIPKPLPENESQFFVDHPHLGCEEVWKEYEIAYLKNSYVAMKNDFSHVNSFQDVSELFKLIASVFAAYIKYSQTGLTHLSQAKELALKSQWTFINAYPFKVLAEEYEKKGKFVKAQEMQKIMIELRCYKSFN